MARGKLKYGDIEFLGLGVRSRKLTFDGRRSGSRARGAPDRALLPAESRAAGAIKGCGGLGPEVDAAQLQEDAGVHQDQ